MHYCKNAGANLDWSYYSKTQTADLQKLSLGAVLSKKDERKSTAVYTVVLIFYLEKGLEQACRILVANDGNEGVEL